MESILVHTHPAYLLGIAFLLLMAGGLAIHLLRENAKKQRQNDVFRKKLLEVADILQSRMAYSDAVEIREIVK